MLGHPVVDLKSLPEREAQLPTFNNILKQQEFLYDRFSIFLNTVVYKGKSSWFRFEWQFRGSGHLHGFL